jgi:hypothetical protein
MNRTWWVRSLAPVLVAASVLGAFQAFALPRYSARYDTNCMLCHVNPTGGGMRSAYASQELVPKEFAWSRATPAMLAQIDPKIGKQISIGTDFREVYLAVDPGAGLAVGEGFFQMQGNVYVSFDVDSSYSIYYDHGMSSTYQLFGLAHRLPWDGYIKAGRFVPSYGWYFDDHTMYVRSEQGFFPPIFTDVGIEFGIAPKQRFDMQVALLNGNRGGTSDNDRALAGALNTTFRFHAGPLLAAVGVEGYNQPGKAQDQYSGGAHGYLNGWNVTWVGQADLIQTDPTGGPVVTGFVTSHELTWLVRQGLELKGTYDFFDPDRDLQSGARSRWGGGVAVMPRSFLALEALYHRTDYESGPALPGKDFNEGVFQIHLLY